MAKPVTKRTTTRRRDRKNIEKGMAHIPIQKDVIDRIARENKIENPGKASIREVRKMIQDVEKERGRTQPPYYRSGQQSTADIY